MGVFALPWSTYFSDLGVGTAVSNSFPASLPVWCAYPFLNTFYRGTTNLVDGLSCILWCGSGWNWMYLAHSSFCSLLKEAKLAVPSLAAACHLHGYPCNWDRSGGQGTDQSSSVASVVVFFPVPHPLSPNHEGMEIIQPSFCSFS